MSNSRFKEGDVVSKLFLDSGDMVEAKEGGKIVCIMDNGQMAGVPWFGLYEGDKLVSKWNAAKLEGVVI